LYFQWYQTCEVPKKVRAGGGPEAARLGSRCQSQEQNIHGQLPVDIAFELVPAGGNSLQLSQQRWNALPGRCPPEFFQQVDVDQVALRSAMVEQEQVTVEGLQDLQNFRKPFLFFRELPRQFE
jgi:hypothetical protein